MGMIAIGRVSETHFGTTGIGAVVRQWLTAFLESRQARADAQIARAFHELDRANTRIEQHGGDRESTTVKYLANGF